jgi:hypothetical protein
MPRDNKGNGFGHGSIMQDKAGHTIRVVGFATVAKGGPINIEALKAVFGAQYKYYRWTELHNVNEKEASAAVVDTTDHCAVDRAQVALGTPVVAMAMSGDDGDKVIWGS